MKNLMLTGTSCRYNSTCLLKASLIFILYLFTHNGFAQPTVQASNITFSAVTETGFTISWTNGNGNARIVVLRAFSAINSTPVDGTNYTANANFANAASSIIGGGKVVFENSASTNSVAVVGLSPGTTYYAQVFEFDYNGNFSSTTSQEYLTTTASLNPNSQTTSAPTAGAQASYIKFSNISSTSITATWTNGTQSQRLVVVKENATQSTSINPIGSSFNSYVADATWSLGSPIETGTNKSYVVYKGSGNSVTVSGLTSGKTYYFKVYEYDGSAFTTSGATFNPNNQTTKPSTQASLVVVSNVTTTTATLNWTNGNGANRIVVAHESYDVDGVVYDDIDAYPEDGVLYSANASYLSGSQIGTGNYVVYSGTGSSVTVTDLLDGVYYSFMVFEYNGSAFATGLYTSNVVVYNTNTSTDNPPALTLTPAKFNFRSQSGGSWESSSIWQEYKTQGQSGSWQSTTKTPSARDIVQIQAGHSVVLNSTVAPDVLNIDGALAVASGAILTVSANKRYSNNMLVAGSGTLTVSGTVILEDKAVASGNSSSNTTFESGSVYENQYRTTEGIIPLATWHSNSTLKLTGYRPSSANLSLSSTSATSWGQSFGHVVFDCPITTTRHIDLDGRLKTINGNLIINSTGISTNGLILVSNNASTTINIGGDLIVSPTAGTSARITLSNSGTVSPVINVLGDVSVAGGDQANGFWSELVMNNSNQTGTPTLNVSGNLEITGQSTIKVNQAMNDGTGLTDATPVLNVDGDLIISSTNTTGSSFNTTGNATINIDGDWQMTNAVVTVGSGTYGSTVINLKGDLGITSGSLSQTGSGTNYGQVNFISGGTPAIQSFTNSGSMAGMIHFNVASNTVLDFGTSSFTGSGDLTQASTATIWLGSTAVEGALQSAGAATGNIQNTGARTFNEGATIIYNGAAAQVMGNGFPNSSTINLTINNSLGVTINSPLTVNGTLSLSNGQFNVASGQSLTINGNLTANTGSIFPVIDSDLYISGSGTLPVNFPFASGALNVRDFGLNRTGASVSVSSLADPVTIGGQLNLNEGSLVFNGSSLINLDGTFQRVNGTLSVLNTTATVSIGGDGAFGTLELDGSGNQVGTLTINKVGSGTASLAGSVTVSTLNLLAGSFSNNGTINLPSNGLIRRDLGELLVNRVNNLGIYNVYYGGNSSRTSGLELPLVTDQLSLTDLTVDGGPVSLNQDLYINGDVSFLSGSLLGNGQTITMRGVQWSHGSGTFAPGSSYVLFDANTVISTTDQSPSFNDITINSSRTVTFPNAVVTVSGDLINNGILVHNNGTISLNGVIDQAIGGAGTNSLFNVDLNNTQGIVYVEANLDLYGAMSFVSGAHLDMNGLTNVYLFTVKSTSDTEGGRVGTIPAGATVEGTIKVERYMSLKGSFNRYVSSPVSGTTMQDIDNEFPLYENKAQWYDESVNGNRDRGFKITRVTDNLIAGKGYLIYPSPTNLSTKWDVSGPLTVGQNQKDVQFDIKYTPHVNQQASDGWNLLGNPYPSPIQWAEPASGKWTMSNEVDFEPVIYIPDVANGVWRFYDYTQPTLNNGAGYETLADGVIATGQAFWVKAKNTSASLTIHESAKYTTNAGTFYRKNTSVPNGLRVKLTSGMVSDATFLFLKPGATPDYDDGKDFWKLEGEQLAVSLEDLYSRKLLYHAVESIGDQVIPVSVKAGQGDFELSIEMLSSFNEMDELYLVDVYNRQYERVSNKPRFTFTVNENAASRDGRFFLTRNPEALLEKEGQNIVSVYPNPTAKTLFIDLAGQPGQVEVYDNVGHLVTQVDMEAQGNRFRGNKDITTIPAGVYFVRTTVDGVLVIKRFIKL